MDYSKNSEDQNIQSSEDQNTQSSINTPDISSNSSTLSNSNNFPPNFLRSSTNSLINPDSPTNSSKNLGMDEFSRSTTKSNTFKDFFFRSRSFSQSNEGSVKSFYSDEFVDPPINIPKVSERNKSLLFQFKPNYNSGNIFCNLKAFHFLNMRVNFSFYFFKIKMTLMKKMLLFSRTENNQMKN